MKYRLKKDLLWLKAEEILPNENSVLKPNFRCLYTIYRDNKARYTESMEICPEEYPDFFEPISEEDEKLEEAKKLLTNNGYRVVEAMQYSALLHAATQSKPAPIPGGFIHSCGRYITPGFVCGCKS